ncbi:hypothetical protein CSQ87_08610 [Bifidobacterium simiarum]|uniref:Uncharacterized protein n=1 Tax=Bifidobacterium simiarum TaxID=2045441 RepID=A0A2M9HD90_9BIFI|nr:hypothetical protein CSQ87_08610 [Bifidobacterium simiarum]
MERSFFARVTVLARTGSHTGHANGKAPDADRHATGGPAYDTIIMWSIIVRPRYAPRYETTLGGPPIPGNPPNGRTGTRSRCR